MNEYDINLDEFEHDTKDTYLGTILQELNKTIRLYPILDIETQKELAVKAQNGDEKAKNKLVNHNLKLVLSRAYRFYKRSGNLDLMELFQEGSLGILRAIETYDYTLGAFSTYAINWIDQAIDRFIKNKKRTIRLPVHLEDKYKKYYEFIGSYEKHNKPLPDDETICDELDITQDTLNTLRNFAGDNMVSLDKEVKEDSDTKMDNFVPYHETGYEDVENSMFNSSLFSFINSLLTNFQFYIIYNRYLSDDIKTLDQLGTEFNITRERIRQIESKALKKIKPYLDKNSSNNGIVRRKMLSSSPYKDTPIDVDNIIMYLIFCNSNAVCSYQKYIFYHLYLTNLKSTKEEICFNLKIKPGVYDLLLSDIRSVMKKVYSQKEYFIKFKQMKITEFGTKIFDSYEAPTLEDDLKDKVVQIYSRLKQEEKKLEDSKPKVKRKYTRRKENFTRVQGIDEVLGLSFDEFKNTYDLGDVRPKHIKLLEKFFTYPVPATEVSEDEIYERVLGYKDYSISLPLDDLYKTYLEYINEFSEEQQLYIECYIFGKKDVSVYKSTYPESKLYTYSYYLFDRLESFHYGLNSFKDNSFTKEKYLKVRSQYPELLTSFRIEILDMYYGVNQPVKKIGEIAKKYNINYVNMNDKISDARDRCITLYNKRHQTLDLDYSKYIPLLHDYRISFVPLNRQILIMFMEENKSYDEISKLTGLNNIRVSNIITDGVRKLDNYYYGIVPYTGYNLDDVLEFFKSSDYSEEEKNIIIDRRVNDMPVDDVVSKYNVPKVNINKLLSQFKRQYEIYLTRDVVVSNEDILKEINKDPFESMLNLNEKKLLAFTLGIKCKYNKKGDVLDYTEAGKRVNLSKQQAYHLAYNTGLTLKLVKIGYIKHNLIYIPKDEMITLLDDIHLPISDYEKDIIRRIYGLIGIPEDTKKIAQDYGVYPASILRRYQRAIISIMKYKDGLLDGKLVFDTDIAPILKYFSKFDKDFLTCIHREGMTYEEFGNKHNLTFNQVVIIGNRIYPVFYDILDNPDGKYFDFDYYDSVVDNIDIPFLGDKELTKEAFNLYTGNTGLPTKSYPEISKELDLNVALTTISHNVLNLMIGVSKYRDGIKLKYIPTYQEVRDYYQKHKDSFGKTELSYFSSYFRSCSKKTFGNAITIPNRLVFFLLLKDKYPGLYDIENSSKEDVIKLISEYRDVLGDEIVHSLQYKHNILDRDLLSSEEYEKMRKIIVSIINKKKKADKKLSLDNKKDT